VLRHAKAASQGPDDHGRPLTGRGRRQATDVGAYVAGDPVPGAPVPELVLSSSARRAVETAELVTAELGARAELVVEPALYGADADDVVEIVRGLGGEADSVMVVGHNPTVHELAVLLLDDEDVGGRARLDAGFPTAALAVIAVATPTWTRLAPGSGTLLALRTRGD
jgi:phosphohistidine phosphatase